MEFVAIARMLRGRWPALAGGVLVALAVAAYLQHSSAGGPQLYESTAQVLVDARTPLIGTTAPAGATTITQRAIFLADLVAEPARERAIAGAAGLTPGEISFQTPAFQPVQREDQMLPDGQLPQLTAKGADGAAANAYYQILLDANYQVPTITITTTAVDPRKAAELTAATISQLRAITQTELSGQQQANLPAPGAPLATRTVDRIVEQGIDQAALQIRQLGGVQNAPVPGGGSGIITAAIGGIVVYFLWCVGAAGVIRRRLARRKIASAQPVL